MVKASNPKSSDSKSKKTDADKAGESKKAAAAPKAKTKATPKAPEEKPAPAAAAKAATVAPSPTLAGPGSDAVLDKPSTAGAKGPRFASKPPRNPFVGSKNPRLRDRDR